MNYDEYRGKSILLFGKTRSLESSEFDTLMALHQMSRVNRIENEVALIIEGRMMDPYEQLESARLYETCETPIIKVEPFEQWLCQSIEPNRLLMSLKLSRDQVRLVAFLKNPYITDELYFKLLKLYDWKNEGLFDNDSNRDVTASIIGRFYKEIERNHNVQYAMSGLAHLIERYGTMELISAIAELSPIAKELKHPSDRTLNGVLDAMALHSETPETILRSMLEKRARLIAHREPLRLEKELLAMDDATVLYGLAQNPTLSSEGADRLEENYPERIAAYYPIAQERFERLLDAYASSLASNVTLDETMQARLMESEDTRVLHALASNSALIGAHLKTLFEKGGFDAALASNPSLSISLLEALYQRGENEVMMALSANTSTPVEILYQLGLDRRYERAVKTNEAYGKHIQTHNIGWH